MGNVARMTQIDGLAAVQIFEAFKCLENKIDNLKSEPVKPQAHEGYLTRQEVAKLLKVSLVTLTDWTNKGLLKSYRLGQKVYYKAAEIDAAMIEIKRGGQRNEAA